MKFANRSGKPRGRALTIFSLTNLIGNTVIVAGMKRGTGEVIGHGYTKAGADLALVGRIRSTLEEITQKIKSSGKKVFTIAVDIGNLDEIQRTVAIELKFFPQIDILVKNAGISPI